MRGTGVALLALCCLMATGAARAAIDCGPANTPGGWQPVDPEVGENLLADVLGEFASRYGANLSFPFCSQDEVQTQVNGCMQVVAGTNIKLWVNVSCPYEGHDYTAGIVIDAFVPLPSANETDVRIYNVDVEMLAVDGVIQAGSVGGSDSIGDEAMLKELQDLEQQIDSVFDDADDSHDNDGDQDNDQDGDQDNDQDDGETWSDWSDSSLVNDDNDDSMMLGTAGNAAGASQATSGTTTVSDSDDGSEKDWSSGYWSQNGQEVGQMADDADGLPSQ